MHGFIIAVAFPKGGTGKSTVAANLTAVAARRGLAALLIDLDPQGSSTLLSGIDNISNEHSAGSMFQDDPRVPSEIAVSSKYGFDVVPAGPGLIGAEDWLARSMLGEQRLRLLFNRDSGLDKYDIVFMDTAGFKGRLLNAALIASSDVVVPIRPSVLSTSELPDFFGIIDSVSELRTAMGDTAVNIAGVVLNEVREHTNAAKANVADVHAALGSTYRYATTVLPEAAPIEEAALARAPVVSVRSGSKIAQRYNELFIELFESTGTQRGVG